MKYKWKTVPKPPSEWDANDDEYAKDVLVWLTEHTAEGWELVTIHNNIGIFKRPRKDV